MDPKGKDLQGRAQPVGGVLDRQEAPVADVMEHRAEALGPALQGLMQMRGIEAVGQRLSHEEVAEGEEGVIGPLEGDAGLAPRAGPPVVAVEIDRQAKRRPG